MSDFEKKFLYVAWQDGMSREWVPVAKLSKFEDGFSLAYTEGAKRCKGFSGLGRMVDLGKTYFSKELFPFFLNRLVSKSRPEYRDYLRWLGLDDLTGDPFSVLTVTGGLRATDSYELIPMPRRRADELVLDFFPRGLRHMPQGTLDAISDLQEGAPLFLLKDLQNPKDGSALLLRSDEPNALVGYIAKYYCSGLNRLLLKDPNLVKVKVKRVNRDAPIDMQLLCTFTAPWEEDFHLIETENDFLPWAKSQDGDATSREMLSASNLLSDSF